MRLNADWQLPWNPALSVDMALLSTGDRGASGALQGALGGEQFTVSGRTTLDIGGRWRFQVGDMRAVARLLVQNIGDNNDWDIGSNDAFLVPNPRRVSLSVAADF